MSGKYTVNPDERMLTVEQVADIFNVTTYTVRSWLKEGRLEGFKLSNKRWRIPYTSMREFANKLHGEVDNGDE